MNKVLVLRSTGPLGVGKVLDGLSGQVLKVKELLLMFLINMFLAGSIIRYRYIHHTCSDSEY